MQKVGEVGGNLIQGGYEGLDAALFGVLPDKEIYRAKSKGGKAFKDLTKYTAATAAFLIPVGWVGKGAGVAGAAIKGVGAAKGINALSKTGKGLEATGKVLEGVNLIKGSGKGVKLANAMLDPRNTVAGMMADYFAYDSEEGHIADMVENYLPQLSNPLTQYLKADKNDSPEEAKLKNVIEGILISPFGGAIGHGLEHGVNAIFKRIQHCKWFTNWTKNGQTPEEATKLAGEILENNKTIDNMAESLDMINTVVDAINKSATEGIDPHATIRENLPIEKYAQADELIETYRKGEKVGMQPDGTLAITVNNWEDAYKVTRHQMRGQSKTAIEDMNKYLADRWAGYGDKKGNLNVDNLVNDYKAKWDIPEDVDIKVQYVEPTAKDLRGREGVTINRGKNNNNITIKISKDSPNQYAVLRSELEHARDYAFGQKPKGPNKHFSRYDVKNESEFASDYLYKKSVSKAIRENKPINNNILDEYNNFNKPVEPKQLGLFEQELATITKSAEPVEVKETQIKEAISKHIPDTVEELDALKQSVQSTVSRDWEAYTKSADELYDSILKNADDLDLDLEIVKDKLPFMTGEQLLQLNSSYLAKNKLNGMLQDEVIKLSKVLAQKPNDVEALIKLNSYQDVMHTLAKEDSHWGSALGTALQERRLSNKIAGVYKEEGLTALEKDGIKQLTDFLTERYFEADKSFFTTDDFVRNIIEETQHTGIKPDRLLEFTDYIHKNLPKELDEAGQKEWVNKTFKVFASSEHDLEWAKAAELAIHPKGWAAFKKHALGNARALQVNGLLSAPPVHIFNGLSGLLNMGLNPATKFVAGTLFHKPELRNEAIDMMVGYIRAWKESTELALKVLHSGLGYDASADLLQAVKSKSVASLSPESFGMSAGHPLYHVVETLGKKVQLPVKLLGSMDTLMRQMNYRSLAFADAMKQTRKKYSEGIDSDTLLTEAEKLFNSDGEYFLKNGQATNAELLYEAQKMLYQNNLDGTIKIGTQSKQIIEGELSAAQKMGTGVQHFTRLFPAFRLVMPFINTPFNVLAQAVEYSPLGLKKALSKNLTDEQRQKALAQVAIGSTMWGVGMLWAANGGITGTTPQGKEGEALLKSGWQPNSFVFKNKDGSKTYVSYSRLEPLASMLSMGADLMSVADAMSDRDVELITMRILGSISQNFTEKAYFRTALSQVNLLFTDDPKDLKTGLSTVGKLAQGMIPYSSALKWANGVVDTDLVQARGFLENIRRGIPFVDGFGNPIEPKRNVYGEALHNQGNLLARLTGTRVSHTTGNPEDMELVRMADEGYVPPKVATVFKDQEMNLLEFRDPETQQTAYDAVLEAMGTVTINGNTLREALALLVESSEYTDELVPDGVNEYEDQANVSRKKMLNHVFNMYKQEALAVVLQNGNFEKGNQTLADTYSNWQASKNMEFYALQDDSDDSSYSDLNTELGSLFY